MADPEQVETPAQEDTEPREVLLPMRLSPFSPPDKATEQRTAARLELMTFSQLRNRRNRIDKRLFELGLSVGEPALAIPSVRGTGLIDLDRILRKLDALEQAREQAQLNRELNKQEGKLLSSLPFDLEWLGEAFRSREIRSRRQLLVSELGLALCACDQRVLAEYAPHVKRLLLHHVRSARRVDELFVEMRLVEEEFQRRQREGIAEEAPKEIDALLARALDSVDEVGTKAVDTIADLGKSAAKTAAKTAVTGGGHAVWAITRGAAKGAWALGSKAVDKLTQGEEGHELPDLEMELPQAGPPLALPPGPTRNDIPELIRQLARLRDEGILTADEFAEKKAQLLERL